MKRQPIDKMKQPLCSFRLVMNEFHSTVPVKNVTPAELKFLCSMHRKNAGTTPVEKDSLVVVDPEEIKKKIESEEVMLTKLQSDMERVEADQTVMEDVRESRLNAIRKRIAARQSTIEGFRQTLQIMDLTPAQELRRLGFKYNNILLKQFYPQAIFPATFEEAIAEGCETELNHTEDSKWITWAGKVA